MSTRLAERIAVVSADQFDRLDDSAGAAGCYHRLRRRESDGRWRVRYALAEDSGEVLAVVPGYTRLGSSWSGQAYDVRSWELPGLRLSGLTPRQCLYVAGCADLRSGLHLAPELRADDLARPVLAELARMAAADRQLLTFPYFFAADRKVVDRATNGAVTWALLGHEARFPDAGDPLREDRARSRVRGVLRRDRRLIAAAGLRTDVQPWRDAAAAATELISGHNNSKGTADHPQFAGLRHEQWARCEQVDLVAFTARTAAVRGVLTALVWRQELELYEIGIHGPRGPEWTAAYLSLLFHQPVWFARERRLTAIRAGLAAEVPKKSRGAILHDVYGGVLSAADTKRLADDQL